MNTTLSLHDLQQYHISRTQGLAGVTPEQAAARDYQVDGETNVKK
jgi:hypothetical protein